MEVVAWVCVDWMLAWSGWLGLEVLETLGRPLETLGRPLETLGRDNTSKLSLSGEKLGMGGTLPPPERTDVRAFDFTEIVDMRLDEKLWRE